MKVKKSPLVLSLGVLLVGGLACSSKNSIVADAGASTTTTCSSPPAVEDAKLMECASCSTTTACSSDAPLEACCTWASEPNASLARAVNLHRYTAPPGQTSVDLSCLSTAPTPLGTPQMVTLTGYVWLFSSGVDSQGVKVEVFTENSPYTDGSISSTALGSYVTTMNDATDPPDPTNTSWNSECPNGCQYRQYTIPNVPTETPLVIKTSDAASNGWATVYDYNIYFPNSGVTTGDGGAPTVSYDATAAAAPDLNAVAGAVGLSVQSSQGLLAGEVHDCGDVRLSGATVGTTVTKPGSLFYFSSDEADPLPVLSAKVTSDLGLFGAINLATGTPVRVTAMGEDPASPGHFLMVGTYVVQLYPGAVTAISLRGRRPWQP